MKIGNIISIIGIALITFIGFSIFTGSFIVGLIIGTALFLITYRLAKLTIKHNAKIETEIIMNSIEEYNNKKKS